MTDVLNFLLIITLLKFYMLQSFGDDSGGAFVGSFPKGFGYGPDENEVDGVTGSSEDKPRILLMGLRRYLT